MDFSLRTAQELIAGLKARQWSSEELTRFFIEKIKKENSEFHAVAFLYEESALKRARELDRLRAQGQEIGALEGLPLTIKDAYRIQGERTTYGVFLYKHYRSRTDSEVIRALKSSGGVFIGRTAVPTACFDWNCKNQVYAECLNPFDKTRTPGGSSGGAAAALALGLTPLELGSDIGGSIRYPAHCCGVVGLRTTDGWLPSQDWGPEDAPPSFEHFGVCGPMARSLEDLKILLDILIAHFPLPASRAKPKAGPMKIAITKTLLDLPPDQDTCSLFERLVSGLQAKGHEVVEAHPDVDFQSLLDDWCLIVGYEYSQAMPRWVPSRFVKKLVFDLFVLRKVGKGYGRAQVLKGASLSREEYVRALARRKEVLKKVDAFYEQHATWILPVSPSPAVPLEECGRLVRSHLGAMDYSLYLGGYSISSAYMGTPSLAFPIGKSSNGLPIGVQMHGPRFGDLELVEIGRRLGVGEGM